jgi:hypothetical protein
MKITIQTQFYNEKRYGKPYIAICDDSAKVVSWGEWLGTAGNAGELSIDAPKEVAILMRGQKDFRGNNSAPKFAVFCGTEMCSEDWTTCKLSVVKDLRARKEPKP